MANKPITVLAIRQGNAIWTTVREKQGQIEIIENRSVSLDLPPGPMDLASADLPGRIKAACGAVKGHLVLALPTARALMRVVSLPSVDAEELKGMAELQVDKFSPFPLAQMSVSLERLDQKESSSRVLVAAAQREQVEQYGQAFRLAGLRPNEVDLEVLGWWRLLKENDHIAEKGRHILLLLDVGSVDLIVTEEGVPVLFRSMSGEPGGMGPEFIQEIAEETGYSLTTLETEQGLVDPTRLSVWHWNEPPPDLLVRLGGECGVRAESFGMNTLPPLTEGLARRALQRGPLTLDLAPAEWHTSEVSHHARMRLLKASAIVLAIWVLGVAGLMGGLSFQENRLRRLKVQVGAVEQPAEEVRQVKQKVAELDQYADRTHSAIECLREISILLPVGLDLTRYDYKKGDEISLRGETSPDRVNLIYEFFEALEKAELFVAVENEKVTTNPSGGRQTTQFTVVVLLREKKA